MGTTEELIEHIRDAVVAEDDEIASYQLVYTTENTNGVAFALGTDSNKEQIAVAVEARQIAQDVLGHVVKGAERVTSGDDVAGASNVPEGPGFQ